MATGYAWSMLLCAATVRRGQALYCASRSAPGSLPYPPPLALFLVKVLYDPIAAPLSADVVAIVQEDRAQRIPSDYDVARVH